MSAGTWGRVTNTRLSPRFKSYVWRDRPTEVVIWKVVLPKGSEVNGTGVGETSPTVCQKKLSILGLPADNFVLAAGGAKRTYSEGRKDGRSWT
jgi:hypothetical protein